MGKLKEIVENQNIVDSQTVIYGIPQVKEIIDKAIYDVGFITNKQVGSEELQQGELLTGDYAIIETSHTEKAVAELWQKLTTAAFYEEQGIQYDESRFIMERYRKELVENGRCEFCVPVK
jgi:DNA gyrase inhibitor GyrI